MQPDDEQRSIRVQLLLTPSEAQEIDDWRFANRVPSRNEAIRQLMRMALHPARKSKKTA